MKVNSTMNIDMDIKNIDFQNETINKWMFSGYVVDGTENIFINIIFPQNKIKTIGEMSFDNLYNTKEIVIPDSVITISDMAFQNSQSIEILNLGNGVQTIGDQAFLYTQGIKELVIPDSVTSIGVGAFSGSFIETLKLSSSLETIGDSAFDSSNIKELTIPASVKSIGSIAFAYSQQLTTVTYLGTTPDAINNKKDVFVMCNSLMTLKVPNAPETTPEDLKSKWQNFLGGKFTDVRKE